MEKILIRPIKFRQLGTSFGHKTYYNDNVNNNINVNFYYRSIETNQRSVAITVFEL